MLAAFAAKNNLLAEQSLSSNKVPKHSKTIDQWTEAELKELNLCYIFQRVLSTSLSKLAQISSTYDQGAWNSYLHEISCSFLLPKKEIKKILKLVRKKEHKNNHARTHKSVLSLE